MSKIVTFLKNESGATAIEYGLIAAGISVAIIAIVNTIGTNIITIASGVGTLVTCDLEVQQIHSLIS